MIYKSRQLRRFWSLSVYNGDPDDPKTKLKTETIVSWNQTDATRLAGNHVLSRLPELISYVTWPENDGDPIYEIYDAGEGPTNKKVKPTLGIVDEDWNF